MLKGLTDRLELGGRPVRLTCGLVPFPRLSPERWGMLLDRAVELGLGGVALDLVWRVHERSAGGFTFAGARDLGRFLSLAAERGLWALLRLGPSFPLEPGLGWPERILCDRGLGSRSWCVAPPRLVPIPDASGAAVQAGLEALWRAAAEVLGPWWFPAGPLLGTVLDPWAGDPLGTEPMGARDEATRELAALVRDCFPGAPLFLGLPSRAALAELSGWLPLADGFGMPFRAGRTEFEQIRVQAEALRALGRPPLALPLSAGASWAEPPRALDDVIFCSLAALMHGVRGFVLESLVERPGFVGAPVRRDATLEPERADWLRRIVRLLERLPRSSPPADGALPDPGDARLALAWQPATRAPFAAGPGVLWLANPTREERRASLRLPHGARARDLWRQVDHAGPGLELVLPPHAVRPLEVEP